jgi:hypothetical protein
VEAALFLVCSLIICLFECGIPDFCHMLYMVQCSWVVDVNVHVHRESIKIPQEKNLEKQARREQKKRLLLFDLLIKQNTFAYAGSV